MKKRFFTKDERLKIYDWLDRHRDDSCAVLIDILATVGCRVDELMRLQFCDINRLDLMITIQRGSKGSESRTRRISQELVNAIFKHKEEKKLTDFDLISDIIAVRSHDIDTKKKMLRRYFQSLKYFLFKNVTLPGLHGFRHSKAVIVFEATRDIYAVKMALGHKSVSSTEHYLTFVDEDKFKDIFAKRA